MTGVLVVDNHDSFVHTLVGYLAELGATVSLVEADRLSATEADAAVSAADAVLVSPGPGTPARAGASIDAIRAAAARSIPVLGVCLGHQAIAAAWGATVTHAPELRHGETSVVTHDGSELFAGVPDTFTAARYHSLAVEGASLPSDLRATAWSKSGVIMALRHRRAPVWGVQFHPESILTEGGYRLLGNWLELAGAAGAAGRGAARSPLRAQGPVQTASTISERTGTSPGASD